MFKTPPILKNFHQLNYLTIIQEKELAQSQIPQIPNYQTTSFLEQMPSLNIISFSSVYNEQIQHYRNLEILIQRVQTQLESILMEWGERREFFIIFKYNDSFEPFMKTKIQIEKKGYQGFENQKAVYQSFENQSPKIKIEISLINQKLIEQIPTLRKRKKISQKLHGNIDLMNSYLQIQLYQQISYHLELQNLNRMLSKKLKK
ncbi:unnamed protein product [Paramecium sonneborni]|uniref:Uncharacterized protein n=1 Tax=Paramecium sonneborni TaxID=65129 RepID=A0A8S1RDE0_9CILI|nr:unnamed protein product [Paramecium sonneborni]CAD8125383.1 unnamed protein product [Paramecium sonneborni]